MKRKLELVNLEKKKAKDNIKRALRKLFKIIREDEDFKKKEEKKQKDLCQWRSHTLNEVEQYKLLLNQLKNPDTRNLEELYDQVIPLYRDYKILSEAFSDGWQYSLVQIRLANRKEANTEFWMFAINKALAKYIGEFTEEIESTWWQLLSIIFKWWARYLIKNDAIPKMHPHETVVSSFKWLNGENIELLIISSAVPINLEPDKLSVDSIHKFYIESWVRTKLKHKLHEEIETGITDWVWEFIKDINDIPSWFLSKLSKIEKMLWLKDLEHEWPYQKADTWELTDIKWNTYPVFDVACKNWIKYRVLSKQIYLSLRTWNFRERFYTSDWRLINQICFLYRIERLFLVYTVTNDKSLLQNFINNPNTISAQKLIKKDIRDPDWELIINNVDSFIDEVCEQKSWWLFFVWDIISLSYLNHLDISEIIHLNKDNLSAISIEDIVNHFYEWAMIRALKKLNEEYSNGKSKFRWWIKWDEFYIFIPNDQLEIFETEHEAIKHFDIKIKYTMRNQKPWRKLSCRLVHTRLNEEEMSKDDNLDYVIDKFTRATNLLEIQKHLKNTLDELENQGSYLVKKYWKWDKVANKIKHIVNLFKWSSIIDKKEVARVNITNNQTLICKLISRKKFKKLLKYERILKESLVPEKETASCELFWIINYLELILEEIESYDRCKEESIRIHNSILKTTLGLLN